MSDKNTTLSALKEIKKKFVQERKWEHHHTPKNLVMALSVEMDR